MENRKLLISFSRSDLSQVVADYVKSRDLFPNIEIVPFSMAVETLENDDIRFVVAQLGTHDRLNGELPGIAIGLAAMAKGIGPEHIVISTAEPKMIPHVSKKGLNAYEAGRPVLDAVKSMFLGK